MNLISQCRAAVFTAIVFVIATVAIPTLHLAFHFLPHDHAGSETHYHPHGHEGKPSDPKHGEGSLAHFSLALSDGAAASFVLALCGVAPIDGVVPFTAAPASSAHVSVARFRGPPCA